MTMCTKFSFGYWGQGLYSDGSGTWLTDPKDWVHLQTLSPNQLVKMCQLHGLLDIFPLHPNSGKCVLRQWTMIDAQQTLVYSLAFDIKHNTAKLGMIILIPDKWEFFPYSQGIRIFFPFHGITKTFSRWSIENSHSNIYTVYKCPLSWCPKELLL